MPYFGNGTGLQIVNVEPARYATDVSTLTDIILVLSGDLADTQQSTLSSAVKIRETDTGTDVPGTLSYSSKTITFTPSAALKTNTNYTITVISGKLEALNGDQLIANFSSSFVTAGSVTVNTPRQLSPADLSIVTSPSFDWTDTAPTYQIQIAKDKLFSVIDIDSEGFSGNHFITSALEPNVQYYWRVRGTGGDWSIIWTFYNGASEGLVSDTEPFSVSSVDPEPGQAFVSPTQKSITVTLSRDLNADSVRNRVKVAYKPIDGDPSVASGVAPLVVNVDGSTMTIVLSEDLQSNLEYRVVLDKGISDIDGNELPENVEWVFASTLAPHYSTVELVRMDIGQYISQFTDFEIDKMILDASKWADFIGEDEYATDNASWYRCYTRYETDNRMLSKAMMDVITTQGENVRLGDFSLSKDTSLVPDINMAIKDVRNKLAECEMRIRGDKGVARPTSAQKSEKKYPYPFSQRRF